MEEIMRGFTKFIIPFFILLIPGYALDNTLSIYEYKNLKQSILKMRIDDHSIIYNYNPYQNDNLDSTSTKCRTNLGVIGLEWMGGCLGGLSTGTISIIVGYVLLPNYQASNFLSIYILGSVGLPFGNALGTTLTGRMLKQKGSYCRNFWWSVGGTIASIAFFYIPGLIGKDGQAFYDYLTAFVSIALPTSCGVFGYNIRDKSSHGFNYDKYKNKNSQYQALLDRAPRVNTFKAELIGFYF
jgi:hypothetical protein